MIVPVRNVPVSLLRVSHINVAIRRPDDSVVERPALAMSSEALDLELHEGDTILDGRYVGQVACRIDGAVSIFAPAFEFEVTSR